VSALLGLAWRAQAAAPFFADVAKWSGVRKPEVGGTFKE
jgi:hypothetical protein